MVVGDLAGAMRGSRRVGSSGGGSGGASRQVLESPVPLEVHGGSPVPLSGRWNPAGPPNLRHGVAGDVGVSVAVGVAAAGSPPPPVSPLNKLRPLGSPYKSPGPGQRLSPLGKLSPVSPSPRARGAHSRYSDSNDPLLQDVDELLSPSTTPRQVISAPSALNPVTTPVHRGVRGVFASNLAVVGGGGGIAGLGGSPRSPQTRMQAHDEAGETLDADGPDREAWRAQRRLRRPLSEDFGAMNLRQYSGRSTQKPFTKEQSVDPDEWGFAEGSSNGFSRAAGRRQAVAEPAQERAHDGRTSSSSAAASTLDGGRPPAGAGARRGRRSRGRVDDGAGEGDVMRFVESRRDPSPQLRLNAHERRYLERDVNAEGSAGSGGSFGGSLGRRKARVVPPSLNIHAQRAGENRGRHEGEGEGEGATGARGGHAEDGDRLEKGSGSSTGPSPRDDASPMGSPSKAGNRRGGGGRHARHPSEGVTTPRVAVEDDPLLVTTRDAILATSGDTSPCKVGSVAWKRGELLGEGAYGKVYTGLNQRNGQLMAVKQLKINPGDEDQAKYVKMLEREVGICKRMRHQHIVGYLGTERDPLKNELYVFLEYVPGGSIASMLKNFGAFSEELVRIYTRQILLGLDYLHANKVVHRDIKGANILVDNHGVVKLADFGSSQSFGKVAKTSNGMSNGFRSVAGSIYWMAPEVMRETGYGRRADIWSVGCTVVEMLSGRRPWPDLKDPWSSIFRIAESKEGPPLPEGISNLARDFLRLCFQRDIKQRPRASQLLNHKFVNPPNAGRPSDAVQKSL